MAGLLSGVVDDPVGGDSFAVPRGQSRQLWQLLEAALPQLLAAGSGSADGLVNVLDCGGGSGSLAVPLAVLGARVTVVDVSIDALGTLLRRAAEAGVSERVRALQGDAEALAEVLNSARFGLVLAHDLLTSVTDRSAVLSQLTEAIAPGGLLSVVIGNPVSAVLSRVFSRDAAGALAILRRDQGRDYHAADLIADCESNGLIPESVIGLGVFSALVPGIDQGGLDASSALADIETATFAQSPYRDIAAKIHVLARRPTGAGSDGAGSDGA